KLHSLEGRNVRFGFSPARECLRGIAVLLHPAKHAEQMPWLREVRRSLPRELRHRIENFCFFFEPTTEVFPRLWHYERRQTFAAELGMLRSNLPAYRDAILRRLSGDRFFAATEMRRMRRPQWYRAAAGEYASRHPKTLPMLERFKSSPSESLRDFCGMLDDFHTHVFLPTWKSIHASLRADIEMRKKILDDFGIGSLLRTLATDINVHRTPGGASIELPHGERELEFDARSHLMLAPSFFCWPGHEVFVLLTSRGLRCAIAYPIPPLTAKAARIKASETVARACDALGDPIRLRILELLSARELSTRELAGFLKIGEPVASRHLRSLLRAGLVRQERCRYFVMYSVRRETMRLVTDALAALH
ncbi:MAG TPA: metalloregulator ArsR/SmtB family transcription factor, partial [Candidatus Cybelea sp.]